MFLEYVDDILGTPVNPPPARISRDGGPRADSARQSSTRQTTRAEAERVIAFVTYLLNAMYRAPPCGHPR
jgi:hypothetical protein